MNPPPVPGQQDGHHGKRVKQGDITLIKPDILRRIVDHCQRIEDAYLSGKTVDLDLLAREFQGADRDFAKSQFDQVLERLRRNFPHVSTGLQEGARPRYEKAELLTQGGMGQLWIAVDLEFNRKVAIKEIVPSSADNEAYRQRFLSEAEITGRLEHPGIVPVYSLGHHGDGRPYYAMRLITGEDTGTLQAAIERLHQQRNDSKEKFDQGTRDLLGRLVNVCQTIAYAHGRGVLHRDLKPANILLGPYGETLVVDWGLARTFSPVPEQMVTDSAKNPNTLGTGSQLPNSMTGTILGTPGFAAPEQMGHVESNSDQTTMVTRELVSLRRGGPWSDIYSLGAILYHILTGQSPLRAASSGGSSLQDLDSRIIDAPRPRAMRSDIPKALEAICLKAMERDPRKRYPDAMALAQELKRYLSGDPIEAWVEPLPVRVSRWFDKHRTISATTTFAMVLTIPLLAFVSMTQSHLRSKYQTASEQLKSVVESKELLEHQLRDQYQRSREREDLAIQAIDSFRDAVVHSPELQFGQQSIEAKRKLLGAPVEFFESFRKLLEQEDASSHATKIRLAKSTIELGRLAIDNGSQEKGMQYYRESIDLLRSIPDSAGANSPSDGDFLIQRDLYLAQSHRLLHTLHLQRHETAEAGRHLDTALSFIKPLEALQSDREDVRLELTELMLLAAIRAQSSGDADYAAIQLASVRDQLKKLQSVSDNSDVLRQVVNLRSAQVSYLASDGQHAAALRELNDLIDFLVEVVDLESMEDPALVQQLAKAYHVRGSLALRSDDRKTAMEACNRCVELYREIVRKRPGSLQYQSELSTALAQLSDLNRSQDLPVAIDLMKQAIDMDRAVLSVDPNLQASEQVLMSHIHILGHLFQLNQQEEDANDAFRQAYPIAMKISAQSQRSVSALRECLELGEHLVEYDMAHYRLESARQRLVQLMEGRKQLEQLVQPLPADSNAFRQNLKKLILIDQRLGKAEINQWLTEFRQREIAMFGGEDSYQRLQTASEGRLPDNPAELGQLASLATDLQDFPLALKLFKLLYEKSPDILLQVKAPLLLNGIVAAVRSADVDRANAIESRELAYRWSKNVVDLCAALGRSERRLMQSQFSEFWNTPELGSIRNDEELQKLPEAERKRWQELWERWSWSEKE